MIDPGRREFLTRSATGLSQMALAWLLAREGLADGQVDPPPATPHHRPRARRVVQLFMSGAASQCDLFDYKPELIARHGRDFDAGGRVQLFQSAPGKWMKSPWRWRQHGECGRWMSELVPNLAQCVDKIAFVHSMTAATNVHGPATFLQNTGFSQPGFPHAGAWISWGLGAASQDLPAFCVLPDGRGFAPNGPANWGAGFLPATHQGTLIRPARAAPIHDLFPAGGPESAASATERAIRSLRTRLDQRHRDTRPGDSRLDARIRAYELAARLQVRAPEALDIASETRATRHLYGLDDDVTADFGRNCLVARRLLERGVRFVQVWCGADNGFPRRNWDSHENVPRDHGVMGRSMDRPAAALLVDLERRGLLDDTIVMWSTEFGRMPCAQGALGRDHNPYGFTTWLAGGGIAGGTAYGATDEFSFRAVENPVTVHDVHATVLHLLGLDHERLTWRHDGIDRRLTDTAGHVLTPLLA